MFQPLANLRYPLADRAAIVREHGIPFDGKDFIVLDMHRQTAITVTARRRPAEGFLGFRPFIGPLTYAFLCPHSTADYIQYAFDPVAGFILLQNPVA